MFAKLLASLKSSTNSESAQTVDPSLAAAALMFEVICADNSVSQLEIDAMCDALAYQFSLDEKQVETVLENAREQHEESVGIFSYTRLINEELDAQQKIEIIRTLWQIAYADQHLSHFEEHTIRRIGDMLYVSHKDFIAAKIDMRDSAKHRASHLE